jgi:hypothetical protein
MKLLQCGKCGKFSPLRFKHCPHCNFVLKKNQYKNAKIALTLFWVFNAVMAVWHIGYWVATASIIDSQTDTANRSHAFTSAFTGSGEIVVYWLAGFFILGIWVLMTRD